MSLSDVGSYLGYVSKKLFEMERFATSETMRTKTLQKKAIDYALDKTKLLFKKQD